MQEWAVEWWLTAILVLAPAIIGAGLAWVLERWRSRG